MQKNLKKEECVRVILAFGKDNMKAIALTDKGTLNTDGADFFTDNVKSYFVGYRKDLKTWRDVFSKKRKPMKELQYRAIRKVLSEVYEETGISKFSIYCEDIESTGAYDILNKCNILTVKKLFKKITLEIVEVLKIEKNAVEPKPYVIDIGSFNTTRAINIEGAILDIGSLNVAYSKLEK